MKFFYRFFLASVLWCLISSLYAKDAIDSSVVIFGKSFNTEVIIPQTDTRSAELEYIKRYSTLTPLSDYKHTLVPGNLTQYQNELKEINNRSNVKVYVLLINGLSLPHYNLVPDNAGDISEVMNWAEGQKRPGDYSINDISSEAKEITERLAAKEARYLEGPVVFCSLVQFDIKYDTSTCKKLTLYHATSYGFEEGEAYLKGLEENISNANWTSDSEGNLSSLISAIRQQSQSYILEQLDQNDLQALRAKLMSINSRSEMNSEIGKVDPNLLLGFDNELRAHVVLTLFSLPDQQMTGYPTASLPYTDPSIYRNVFAVLENIEDANINAWYEYIQSTKVSYGNITIFRDILQNVDGIVDDDEFLNFITLVNRQLKRTQDFSSRIESLFDSPDLADKVIVWDKSYALKVTTPPVGTNSYEVKLGEGGSIKLIRSYVDYWTCIEEEVPDKIYTGGLPTQEICVAKWESEPEVILDPFDLVVFIDRSDLSILDGVGDQNAQVVVVPAIMLKYAQDKKIKANMAAGFFLGLDAVTIVIPIGSAYNLAKVSHRVYRVLDWAAAAGAAANIVVNVNDYDPKYKAVVDAYNSITAVLDIGALAGAGARKLSDNFAGNFVSEVNQPGIKAGLEGLAKDDPVIARLLELERELVIEAKVAGKTLAPPGSSSDLEKEIIKFFEDDEVKSAAKMIEEAAIQSKYPNISVAELTAVYHYTTEAYRKLNSALRGFSPMTEHLQTFANVLNAALEKFPKYFKTTFRGTAVPEQVVEKYRRAFADKTTVIEEAFSSSSKESKIALAFLDDIFNPGDVKVFFTVEGKSGVDIEDVSSYGPTFSPLYSESEVLFKSGREFEVTQFSEGIDNNGDKLVLITIREL